MSALEIKPGKYRTRGGSMVDIVHQADHYWFQHGYAWRAVSADEADVFYTVDGRYRSQTLYGNEARHDSPFDLIERIEDEPKAEDKCSMKVAGYEFVCGFDLSSGRDQASVSTFPVAGEVAWASDRKDIADPKLNDFTAEFLSLAWRSRVDALEAKIARLEAENESLSRQLRSRELNKDPASAGKVWRWSPMV